jgi:hypothetical protein
VLGFEQAGKILKNMGFASEFNAFFTRIPDELIGADPARIAPKAPGERLPVPAGWRFAGVANRNSVP